MLQPGLSPKVVMAGDEEDEEGVQRKQEYLQFRRSFDQMRAKEEGAQSQADSMKSQGNQFFQLGLYMQASIMYSEALELQPSNTVLLNNRAMAYLKQAMPQEALADANLSLSLDQSKENIKAHWRKAQALLDLDRYEDAEEAANEGIAVQASNQHLSRVRRKAREAIALRRLCGINWVGAMENGVEKKYIFFKDGEMCMTVVGHELKATFDLSVECTPQSMVVKMKPIFGSGGAPPPPVPYIYKFEDGDQELWLCHPVGSNDLPTKFEGPGCSRLRRGQEFRGRGWLRVGHPGSEMHKKDKMIEPTTEVSDEPLEQRCLRYMQEFNQILPVIPPQLPERPSEEEVSQEILLMQKVTKLKQRYGHEVHQRAMELAKGEVAAVSSEVELAEGLRERLVARKVLPSDSRVIGPGEAAPKVLVTDAGIAQTREEPAPSRSVLDSLLGLVRKICCA
eukprot:symbB.v1.2.029052.t1/scaffold3141.1/size62545/2